MPSGGLIIAFAIDVARRKVIRGFVLDGTADGPMASSGDLIAFIREFPVHFL